MAFKSYLKNTFYQVDQSPITGILLTNLGTPDAPTAKALRNYLGEFLADPRITELPRWFWWFILHGVILRVRPRRSAKKYAKVWTENGSPLLHITHLQAQALQQAVNQQFSQQMTVAVGMRYGNPSIAEGLVQLQQANAQRILILPLYPQYSSSTTGSTFDAIAQVLQKWRWIPELRFINHYYAQEEYIQALAAQIQAYWAIHGQPDKLLFSFHGTPKRFVDAGDPYYWHCQQTANLVAAKLQLTDEQWQLVFQSRFGQEEWLKPYTDQTLIELANSNIKRVDIICPGFATDCLETLEEIDQENRALFLTTGGSEFHYIPALNDSPLHINALLSLVMQHMQGFS